MSPYIGITGITSRDQATSLAGFYDQASHSSSHKLMLGILVSQRALAGQAPGNRRRFPDVAEVPRLCFPDPLVLNLAHYNFSSDLPAPPLARELLSIMKLSPALSGVQLNMAWPDVTELQSFRNRLPNATLVLQVGNRAYLQAGSAKGLVERLKPYEELVDYVLFDPSGGAGKPLDIRRTQGILGALVSSGLAINWGVAGGLSGETIHKLERLLEIYPDLSWDAEGRLRDDQDNLDLEVCRSYLRASAELLT